MNIKKHILSLEGPIVVFGASGFIGANLFKRLLAVRDDVYAVCRKEKGWRLDDVDDKKIIFTDINDKASINHFITVISPKVIFDLIAYGAYSFEDRSDILYQTNFLSLTNIISSLKDKNISAFIHAGSSSEYGSNSKSPNEDARLEPNSHYSSSKVAASYYLNYEGKFNNFPVINLRLYSVYGPLEDTSRLIPNILKHASNKEFPPLVNENISRDFIFIDDACDAFILAASKINPDIFGESFNIGSGKKTTIKDLASTVKKIFKINSNPSFSSMKNRDWDLEDWFADPSKANEILGWYPQIKIEDGLRITFDWIIKTPENNFKKNTKKNFVANNRSISALVACYKDEQAIPIMYQRLSKVFNDINIDYEIIFVNDASPDNSAEIIRNISESDSRVVGITHSRNFGSQMAFRSGMELATKQAVVLLDGDLQDPPELIKEFVKKWNQGNDVVYGVRVKRDMPLHIEFMYKSFYRILTAISFIKIPKDAGDFSLIDKRVVNWIIKCPERDLFMRGIRAYIGFKQTGVNYIRPSRMFGSSTNNLIKNIGWAKMGILSFTNTPLNLMSIVAVLTVIISIITASTFLLLKIFFPEIAPKGFTTVMLLILIFGSLNLFAVALIGEYIGKIVSEVKQRPRLIRSEIIRDGKINKI